jgi:hypothetical protein
MKSISGREFARIVERRGWRLLRVADAECIEHGEQQKEKERRPLEAGARSLCRPQPMFLRSQRRRSSCAVHASAAGDQGTPEAKSHFPQKRWAHGSENRFAEIQVMRVLEDVVICLANRDPSLAPIPEPGSLAFKIRQDHSILGD